MAAKIDSDGTVTQLDRKAAPREPLTEADAKDAARLTRILAGLLDDVAELRRRYAPRWVDFEDVDTSAATITLEHGFGGRVRWSVVGTTSGAVLTENASTTATALVLTSDTTAGLSTIRVEAVDG